MNEIIVYASVVIGFASFAQTVTGVGFAMVASPFLLQILDVKDTVLIIMITSLMSQILIVYKHWRVIHPRMFLNFILGSILGAPFGLWLFSIASLATLKLIIGGSLFAISSFSILSMYKNWHVADSHATYQVSAEAPLSWNIKELSRCISDRSGRIQLFTGSIAGFFGPSIGLPGIPLTVYFNAVNVDKEVARATALSFFIVLFLSALIVNYGAGAISASVIGLAPLLIPSLLIGMAAGNMVFPHIPQRWFQLLLNATILYSACKILIESF